MAGVCDANFDFQANELRGQAGQTLGFAFRGPEFDLNVLALDIAEIPQPLLEIAEDRLGLAGIS